MAHSFQQREGVFLARRPGNPSPAGLFHPQFKLDVFAANRVQQRDGIARPELSASLAEDAPQAVGACL